MEKNLTLELSLEIRKQIEFLASSHPGTKINCILTRTGDSNPDFSMRATTCASSEKTPTAIVSIHFNASENHDCLGTLAVIGSKKNNPNFDKDQEFANGLITATSEVVTRFLPDSKPRKPIMDAHLHGGSGSNFFYHLALHPPLKDVPKCFLEVEFMDRRDAEAKLLNNRKTVFPKIAKAIADYLYLRCEESDRTTSNHPLSAAKSPAHAETIRIPISSNQTPVTP